MTKTYLVVVSDVREYCIEVDADDMPEAIELAEADVEDGDPAHLNRWLRAQDIEIMSAKEIDSD